MHLNMSSWKWWPSCLSLNVLTHCGLVMTCQVSQGQHWFKYWVGCLFSTKPSITWIQCWLIDYLMFRKINLKEILIYEELVWLAMTRNTCHWPMTFNEVSQTLESLQVLRLSNGGVILGNDRSRSEPLSEWIIHERRFFIGPWQAGISTVMEYMTVLMTSGPTRSPWHQTLALTP